MAGHVAERLSSSGQAARTVTTKVRYPDFSIRSRSQSAPVGIDDPARIGELACALLDRALADRPGALRLVGVGVSGLSGHRQLTLDVAVANARRGRAVGARPASPSPTSAATVASGKFGRRRP